DRGERAGHTTLPARVRNPDATTRAVRTDPVEGTAQPLPPAPAQPPPPAQPSAPVRPSGSGAGPAAQRGQSAPAGQRGADAVAALAALGVLASDSYQPGTALRQFILTRDVTCRFPTCRQPGRRCQIDHIVPFDPARPAWAQTHQG